MAEVNYLDDQTPTESKEYWLVIQLIGHIPTTIDFALRAL